jgi:hypothetical protein
VVEGLRRVAPECDVRRVRFVAAGADVEAIE